MANFVCDICGGKITMKSGGVGECSQCGMEYSTERLREKAGMQSGVQPTGTNEATVKTENNKIKNYLKLAENELNAGFHCDTKKALEYCDKVIEIDGDNFDAWYLKAQLEITCMQFANALRYGVDLCKRSDLTEEQKKKAYIIVKTAIDRWLGSYQGTAWSLIVPDIACLADIEDGKLYEEVMKKALKGLREMLKNADQRISDYMSKDYIWKTEYAALSDGDFVLRELDYVISTMSKIPEKMHARFANVMLPAYKEAEHIYGRLKNLSYDSGNYLSNKKNKVSLYGALDKTIRNKISDIEDIERVEKKRVQENKYQEQKKKAEAYWAEHPEEKIKLENELERIEKEWALAEAGLNEFFDENPKEKEIEEQISSCQKAINELSLFKMKEKKELKEKMIQLEKKLKEAEDEYMERKQKQIIKVDELEKMHKAIKKKLTRM